MSASLRALLNDAIDYAGIFPPARLSLQAAAANFAHYQESAASWMLARFVCSVPRLAELEALDSVPKRIAAVGRSAESKESFRRGLADELRTLAELQAKWDERLNVELYEALLPLDILNAHSISDVCSFISIVADSLSSNQLPLSAIMFEVALGDDWQERLESITAALATANEQRARESNTPRFGLKLRMGGATAQAIPSTEQVAQVIAACREAQIPWKATAGLHRPQRHAGADGTPVHGFLNVLAATVLACVHCLGPAMIEQIVDDPIAGNFVFGEHGFAWEDYSVTMDELRAARQRTCISFGSCSFDEPCGGLREWGLL